jgi:hypothetical protein
MVEFAGAGAFRDATDRGFAAGLSRRFGKGRFGIFLKMLQLANAVCRFGPDAPGPT